MLGHAHAHAHTHTTRCAHLLVLGDRQLLLRSGNAKRRQVLGDSVQTIYTYKISTAHRSYKHDKSQQRTDHTYITDLKEGCSRISSEEVSVLRCPTCNHKQPHSGRKTHRPQWSSISSSRTFKSALYVCVMRTEPCQGPRGVLWPVAAICTVLSTSGIMRAPDPSPCQKACCWYSLIPGGV